MSPFALLLLAAAPQQYEILAEESFDYGNGALLGQQNGAAGWCYPWYSGPTDDHAVVTAPGFDGSGLRATTVVNNGGSWRSMNTTGFDPILDFGQYGRDGTTVWVRFWCQRAAGSDDDYGGLSLYVRFGGEMLFLGSPSFTEEWGLHDLRFHPAPQTVLGTDCDNLALLVYQIDFLPGKERVRMWVDPSSDHPTATPDLDVLVDDFRFNEIRLQSGNGVIGSGFHFDGIAIDTPAFRPLLSVTNPVAGQVATLHVVNATPGSSVVFAYSLNGAGPVNSPYGNVYLTPPIQQLAPIPVNAQGEVHLNVGVPAGLAGTTVWAQALEATGPGTGNLSNPLAVLIQ